MEMVLARPKNTEIDLVKTGIKPLDANGLVTFSVTVNVSHYEFLRVTGINLPSRTPSAVFASVRAPNDDNPQYSDSFALTVNEVEQNVMNLKIWRVDSSQNPSAAIRIDVLVVP